jgi:hypothetical protein
VHLTLSALALFLLCASTALAQDGSRLYLGAVAGSNVISAEDTDRGAVGAVGGTVGVKVASTVLLQLDLVHGAGELSRQYEGIGVSFAGPNASRDEIERLGVYQRFDRTWRPQFGWSAVAVWRDAQPRRVSAAVFTGLSATWFDARHTITTLRIPEGVDPNNRFVQGSIETFTATRGGIVGGVMVPIKARNDVTIAPEIRYLYGSFGDERYTAFTTAVRLLWRFDP